MGIETLLIAGLSAVSALSSMSSARKQAKAIAQEGEIESKNLAKKVRYAAAEQSVNFLNSGITLNGDANDTPMAVINETYNTGLEDLNLLRSNYNAKSKAAISEGRSKAIGALVSGFSSAGFGGMGAGASSGFMSGLGKFGNMVGAGNTAIGDSIGGAMNSAGYGMDAYTFLDG